MHLGRPGTAVLGVFVESPPASTRADVSVRRVCVQGSGSPLKPVSLQRRRPTRWT